MDAFKWAVLIISLLALAFAVIAVVLLLKKKSAKIDTDTIKAEFSVMLDDKLTVLKTSVYDTIKMTNDTLNQGFQNNFSIYNEKMDNLCNKVDDKLIQVIRTNDENIGKMRGELERSSRELREEGRVQQKEVKETLEKVTSNVNKSLADVRQDNEKQLEKMRETVDEKLSSTLNERLNSSFEIVNNSLQSVNKELGEMKELSHQVSSLNKIFTNNKTYGNWGEVALEGILEQIMAPEQYMKQAKVDRTNNVVDFVVRMPNGQSGEELYLPIDSKFPLGAYESLLTEFDSGDMTRIEIARKNLYSAVKKAAKSISEKYINPPKTTNFAVMYLPAESLFAEVIRNTPLVNELLNIHRVSVCGPTTIAALLNSLQVGFTTLKIQKKSSEIGKLFEKFKRDFIKFSENLDKTHKKASEVVTSLEKAKQQTIGIQKNIASVQGTDSIIQETEINYIEDAASDKVEEI